jgi:hypothetical protein
MSAEIHELTPPTSSLIPVTTQDVENLKRQRDLIGEFVRSQLKEADFSDKAGDAKGEGDYGVIPGTKKMCLLKPGAEKLLRLFGLGARFRQTDKEVDRHANFALYSYRCEIFVMSTGRVVAECEGTTNSQEKKWKERTVWKKNSRGQSESTLEETPIYDVLNTLQKMAQKRALIGATLLATGASEYFTQDVLEPDDLIPPAGAKPPVTPKADKAEKEVPSEVSNTAPECCGKAMMISKYPDKETGEQPWYCVNCKKKLPRTA